MVDLWHPAVFLVCIEILVVMAIVVWRVVRWVSIRQLRRRAVECRVKNQQHNSEVVTHRFYGLPISIWSDPLWGAKYQEVRNLLYRTPYVLEEHASIYSRRELLEAIEHSRQTAEAFARFETELYEVVTEWARQTFKGLEKFLGIASVLRDHLPDDHPEALWVRSTIVDAGEVFRRTYLAFLQEPHPSVAQDITHTFEKAADRFGWITNAALMHFQGAKH